MIRGRRGLLPWLQGRPSGAPIGLRSPVVVARQLTGTPYAAEVLRLADEITKGRLPLFGELAADVPLVHLSTTVFKSGFVQSVYTPGSPAL